MPHYDLEIAMSVTNCEGRYAQRLVDFKKYGLSNVKNRQVLLALLTGTEIIPSLSMGWPDNVEVKQVSCGLNHPAAKTYAYYTNYDPQDLDESDWFMRVDDDSVTDISHLLERLSCFDPHESCYFTTELIEGETHIEQSLLKSMNLPFGRLDHEIECCVVSRQAMKKILSNPDSRRFLEARSKIEDGYTDIAFAEAAKMCAIFPYRQDFLTSEPDVRGFLGGFRSHIHFVAHDQNERAWKFLIEEEQRRRDCKFVNKELFVGLRKDAVNIWVDSIVLSPSGLVMPSNPDSWLRLFWTYENDELCLVNEDFTDRHNFRVADNESIPYVEEFVEKEAGRMFLRSFDKKPKVSLI